MAPVPAPVLDLTTVLTRRPIAIDGRRYDLRDPSEVTIQQQLYLERTMPRLGELLIALAVEDKGSAAEAEADRILRQVCEMAIDAPKAVLDRLTLSQRVSIVQVFLKLPPPTAGQTEAILQAAMRARRTGATSSRGSSGRTAATRSGGTRRSRSTSSART